VSFRAAFPQISVRVTVHGEPADAQAKLALLCERVRGRIGDFVFGEGADTMEGVVNRLLRERGWRLATAESCTGGLVSERLTTVPGSSRVFVAGLVAYTEEAKRSTLGVRAETLERHGAVSEEVAREMAAGARGVTGADVAVSVTGVAGPDGGSEENPVGKSIRIGEWRMRVIGVNGPRGTHLGQNLDEVSIVPVATGMQMFNRTSLFRIMIELRPGSDTDAVKREIEDVILDRHREIDVTCVTPDSVVDSLSAIVDTLTLVLVGIAAISLGVAGIGIMNVMLVAVSERRAEIGLLKAVGATQRQVLMIFLMESLVISTTGAAIGLGAGYATIAFATWLYPAMPAEAPLWAVAAVLGLSVCAGAFFGVLPARRAMRLDPIVALSSKG